MNKHEFIFAKNGNIQLETKMQFCLKKDLHVRIKKRINFLNNKF